MWHRLLSVLLFLSLAAPLAQAAPTTPTADFTDNGDGTVTHKTTGLTWKRCAEGQTWTGSTCSGTVNAFTWSQANALGFGGWRLPTIAELVSIVERDNVNPAINTTIFPSTSMPSPYPFFWSVSPYIPYAPPLPDSAWRVQFDQGNQYYVNKTYYNYVRLVRGGQPLDSSGLYTPTSDFSDNGDGSVTHKKTGLTWKRCTEGQAWTGSACSGTAKTYVWNDAKLLAQPDWRLPSQNELLTIVEWSKYDPAINVTIFPSTPSAFFWSTSNYLSYSGTMLSTDFYSGMDTWCCSSGKDKYVRLVRGAQSVAVLSPQISNVTPQNPILGQATTFTVTGTNLVSGMGIYIPGCTPAAGQTLNVLNVASSTSATYQCSPGTSGQQASEIKTAPGGTVLYNFNVTVSAPTYSVTNISANPTSAVINLPITFTVTGSGLTSGMAWYLPDCVSSTGNQLLNVASSTSASFTCTPNATGLKSGYVKTAVAGVVMANFDITVGAAANQPPVAAFTATPASGAAPLTVSLDASASSDPDGSIVSYAWTTSDNQIASGKTASFTFKTSGAITLTLTVTDNKGATNSAQKTITLTQTANKPPVASFSASPTSGAAPLTVKLDASASNDPDGSIVSYAWSRQNATGKTTSLVFPVAGTYDVTLTVTDDKGATGSATKTITVEAQVATIRTPKIYINVNTPVVRNGDIIRWIVSADNTSNDVTKYDVVLAVAMPDGVVFYDNGKTFDKIPSYLLRQYTLPGAMDWLQYQGISVGGVPEGAYTLYLMLVNGGKLVAWDSVIFEVLPGKGGKFAAVEQDSSQAVTLSVTSPAQKNIFQGTSGGKSIVEQVVEAAEKFDHLKKGADFVADLADDYDLVQLLEQDKSLGQYAEQMQIIRLMFFLLDKCEIKMPGGGAVSCLLLSKDLGKYVVGGYQRLINIRIGNDDYQISQTGGLDSIQIDWRDDKWCPFDGMCFGNAAPVDLYVTPIEICTIVGSQTVQTWNQCASNRQIMRERILASPQDQGYRLKIDSNVTGKTARKPCTGLECTDSGGWYKGIYLVEAVDPSSGLTISSATHFFDKIAGTYILKRPPERK